MRKNPSPDCLAEAERWHARLMAPDCMAAERLQFERWSASAHHAIAYARTVLLWQSLGQLAGRPDFQQLSQQILADTAPRSFTAPRRGYLVAASILLIVLTGVFAAYQQLRTPTVVYLTKPGERRTIELTDGSTLILNSDTELDVRLGRDKRRVTLRQGEVLFSVAHDAKHPFKVDAGDGEVTALGTRFEVKNNAGHVLVTLLEGSVVVDRSTEHQHIQLKPADQLRFTSKNPELNRRIVDPEVASSWSTGRLRFRATPLSDVIEEVNRYSSTQIRLSAQALSGIPMSGTFEIGDTDSVASAMEALLPLKAVRQGADVLLQLRD